MAEQNAPDVAGMVRLDGTYLNIADISGFENLEGIAVGLAINVFLKGGQIITVKHILAEEFAEEINRVRSL